MAFGYNSPGVYREEIFLAPETKLPTGIPGFVGYPDDRVKPGMAFNAPFAVHRAEEFVLQADGPAKSFLADVVEGFFANGGVRCYVALADPGQFWDKGFKDALASLASINDLDLVAVPDAFALGQQNSPFDALSAVEIQRAALDHCHQCANRLAILDSLPEIDTTGVLAQHQDLLEGQAEPLNGALYYPWLITETGRSVPPCGHVAGIIARTDARTGVFKVPANEELSGVLDLTAHLDNRAQDALNPDGINCLRAFQGRGIRVWGARTLSRDADWRYVNVRRLFLTLGRWIDANMGWAGFEPNDKRLWVRIQRELNTYLTGLWRLGALQGRTVGESFYVKCDEETNPPEIRETGQVVTEIGMSTLHPAEFVVVRIVRRAAGNGNV